MRRNQRRTTISICALFFLICTTGLAAARQAEVPNVKVEMQKPSAHSRTVAGSCGDELEFDRNSGRMIRKNRVDLVVAKVELKRGNSGVFVLPSIQNICPGAIPAGTRVDVTIEDVVISMAAPASGAPLSYGSWVGLGEKRAYRVTVDSAHRVSEIRENNNTCVATFPAGTASRVHNCP